MAITSAIRFGLTFATAFDLNEYIELQDEQNPNRINAQLAPKRHGALVGEVPVLGPRTIRLQGRVYGSDEEDLRTTVKLIEKNLGTTRKRLYYFSDRFYNAYRSGWSWSFVPGSAQRVANISIEFFCDNPFEYADIPPADTTIVLTSSDTVIDITQNIYRKEFTLTNNGNIYSYFKSTMTANQGNTVTYSLIRNVTKGRNNQFTGTVALNKSLVIDNNIFSVKNDGTEDLANFNGSFLSLDSGANIMQVEGQPATYVFHFDERF